jgi:uncharacterized protein (DUF2147 family)/peptidoglycan/LPS O-acetylase OafA/YrhL
MSTQPLPSESSSERRHDLDALRVFGCYLLFLFHVGMVFNPSPFFHVRNEESSMVFLIVCGFIGLWHMPLLFILAGWSAATSLRTRGVGAFLRERGSKLAIPLVAGCILLMPMIKFLELRSGQDLNHRGYFVTAELQESIRSVIPVDLPIVATFDESFWSFLPTFFTNLDRFTWSHLWFVAYLLTLTLVLLPALVPLARIRTGAARVSRLWVYLPILPLVLVQLLLRERFPGPYNLYNDWASVSFYVTFLLSGFSLAVVPEIETRLREERRRLLALGVLATGVLLAAVLGAFQSTPVVLAGTAVAGWCYVAAILGFARERVTRTSPRLRYLAESAFPIYVLHQPVVVVLGAAVVALPLGVVPKFVLLLSSSVAVTLAFYHYGIRPLRLSRFLLGMKPKRREARGSGEARASAPAAVGARASLLLPLAFLFLPSAADASDPTGLWWAEGGSAKVEIRLCGDALCGEIVDLTRPFDEDGRKLRDVENPDPTLRNRTVIGLDLISNLRATPGEPSQWTGGEIYDPASGNTYQATLEIVSPDCVNVRGYVGVQWLGRTTTWIRVGAERECGGER